ncbi:MAG: ribosome-associated GTPase EngA [Chloroflexi bacterium]|nr:ribosome-associated GTPase EngA [Chloroflexota bacterium]
MRDVPILFTSALTRQRVRRILDLALEVKDQRVQRVPTGELNHVIQDALRKHQPMSHSGRMLKLRYVTQVAIDPPTFVFFVNDPALVHFSYRRFLENQLREQFGFSGTALRLIFRSSREAPETAAPSGKPGTARKRVASAGRTTVRQKSGGATNPKRRQTGGTTIMRKANRPLPKP